MNYYRADRAGTFSGPPEDKLYLDEYKILKKLFANHQLTLIRCEMIWVEKGLMRILWDYDEDRLLLKANVIADYYKSSNLFTQNDEIEITIDKMSGVWQGIPMLRPSGRNESDIIKREIYMNERAIPVWRDQRCGMIFLAR